MIVLFGFTASTKSALADLYIQELSQDVYEISKIKTDMLNSKFFFILTLLYVLYIFLTLFKIESVTEKSLKNFFYDYSNT